MCDAYRIRFNGMLLPEVFFRYEHAKRHLAYLRENSCAGFGEIVDINPETGLPY